MSRLVECTIPVLPVTDLKRSIQFYTEKLGFGLDWGGAEHSTVCSVSRDGCHIMLSQNAKPCGSSCVWIGLENDSLFREYIRQGVTVLQDPKNYPWAYEMKFADIDGNVLWLGTESRSDQPIIEP